MTSLQRTFATTAAAVALLGLTSVAHAAPIVFTSTADGTVGTGFNGLGAGGVTSTTNADGSITLAATTPALTIANGGNPTGTDIAVLTNPITANSGIWTLTATVNLIVTPQQPAGVGQFGAIGLGFGTFLNTLGPTNALGNTFTGFNDTRFSEAGANGSSQFTVAGNRPVGGGTETQTGPLNFAMSINTNGPQYVITVTNPNGTTQTFNAAATTWNDFGIGLSAGDLGTSATFSNLTLTDTVTSAVPEPSTWAMMVLGFAGLGFLAYRRKDRKGGLNFRLV